MLAHDAAIKPGTFVKTYGGVLAMAVQLLQGQRDTRDAADLIDACLRVSPSDSRARNDVTPFRGPVAMRAGG